MPRKPPPISREADDTFAMIQRGIDDHMKVRADKREEEHWELRKKFINEILGIFIKANIVVLLCVGIAIAIDIWNGNVTAAYADKRIFDKDVLLGLIASTTVQLGAIALAVSNWLFRDKAK
jgi:hypothetical protein